MDGDSAMECETGRGENVQIKLPGSSKSINLWLPPDWSISSIKNSFIQRTISATRDFPPRCGRSASLHLSSEDQCDQSGIAYSMRKSSEQEIRQDKPLPDADAVRSSDAKHKGDNSVEVVLKCPSGSCESIGDNVLANKKIRPSCEIIMRHTLEKSDISFRQRRAESHIMSGDKNIREGAKVDKGIDVYKKDTKGSKRKFSNFSSGPSGSSKDHLQEESPMGSEGFHQLAKRPNCSDKSLPPAEGPGTSNAKGDDDPNEIAARERVKEILQLFRANCWKLIHENKVRRVDLEAAKILKKNRKFVNTGKRIGHVTGVNVGDRFHYRIELAIVGLHRPPQTGIDYLKVGEKSLAVSIVASGRYANSLDSNVLIYMGHGGNVAFCRNNKPVEDQKLKKGNLALKNSIYAQNPVRVIRTKDKESSSTRTSIMDEIFIYDGLYLVQECWRELGPNGKRVFKFRLERIPDQPRVSWQ